jgi:creatinine amidohydrolase
MGPELAACRRHPYELTYVSTVPSSRNAAELPYPELRSRLGAGTALILPVGSFEQHGPHLPLATDAMIARALADAVAERVDGLVLPTLPYGAPSRPRSGGGDLFPAPDLPLSTLIAAAGAIAEGAILAGCRWLVVLSWHMENAAVLWEALRGPAARGKGAAVQLFEAPWDYLTPELEGELFPDTEPSWADDHAGRLETAMMLHLANGLVGEAPAPEPYRPRRSYDVLPTPPDSAPSSGVVLDARDVTAEQGERCTRAIVAGIAAAVAGERSDR